MVVHDFHFDRAWTSLGPLEADPPLVVDADAPLLLASTLERLQTVAGPGQVAQARGRVELVELARGGPGEPGKRRDPATPVERLGLLVREADDHNTFRSRSIRITSSITHFAVKPKLKCPLFHLSSVHAHHWSEHRGECCPISTPFGVLQSHPNHNAKAKVNLFKWESAFAPM